MYESIDGKYVPTTAQSFNAGNEYYYQAKDNDANSWTKFTGTQYSSRNGQKCYDMPMSSKELPLVTDEKGNTYYLDTLITSGDQYKNKKFTPKDTNGDGTDNNTTYGYLLLAKVKDAVSIHNFVNNVNADIPDYLKKNITSIGYVAPDFKLFGDLFLEKLNAVMKDAGDTIVKKYENDDETVEIVAALKEHKGTITSEKKKKQ